jgi:hypothetical protein
MVSEYVVGDGAGAGMGAVVLEAHAAMKSAEENGRAVRRASGVSEESILELILLLWAA